MTLGALAITVGVPSAYYLLDGSASGDHFTGLLAIVAGVVLLLLGPVTLWKERRAGGANGAATCAVRSSSWRRPLLASVIVWSIVFPIGFAYIYVHTGRAAVTPDLHVPYEPSPSSPRMGSGWPPRTSVENRATVVLLPERLGPGRRGC